MNSIKHIWIIVKNITNYLNTIETINFLMAIKYPLTQNQKQLIKITHLMYQLNKFLDANVIICEGILDDKQFKWLQSKYLKIQIYVYGPQDIIYVAVLAKYIKLKLTYEWKNMKETLYFQPAMDNGRYSNLVGKFIFKNNNQQIKIYTNGIMYSSWCNRKERNPTFEALLDHYMKNDTPCFTLKNSIPFGLKDNSTTASNFNNTVFHNEDRGFILINNGVTTIKRNYKYCTHCHQIH